MKVIFPGSFDPLTKGHLNIIKRVNKISQDVTIVVTVNRDKTPFISASDRVMLIQEVLKAEGLSNIKVDTHDGFIVNYCKAHDVNVIIRGLRNSSDLMYEQNMYIHNNFLNGEVETLCLFTDLELSHISSSDVRLIYNYKPNKTRHLVPEVVADYLERKYNEDL